MESRNVIIENDRLRLTIGADCVVRSLVLKSTGEELAAPDGEIPFFSVTQERPFNNEIKLSHPCKQTTFQANRIERTGNELTVGFELAPYTATIEIREAPDYLDFRLKRFNVFPNGYGRRSMDLPPVSSIRLIQLPVAHRNRFGEWLNAVWDDVALVNVAGTSPYTVIDSERRKRCRILYAEVSRESGLYTHGASLIVCAPDDFLDIMDRLEHDHALPYGVESRRSGAINRSVYWTDEIFPENAERHIEAAKRGGFSMMLLYYQGIFRQHHSYDTCSEYEFNEHFPRGFDDLREMLAKIRAAGISPGLHILQTHVGIRTHYVTPKLDHRLNKTRLFTLAKPLGTDDDTIFVEENPVGAMMHPDCRVLGFGTEAISYESYTTEVPFRFLGCKRGAFDTEVVTHPQGEIGGTLDISEYGHVSIYVDQSTSLQDEIADEIAKVYRCGFEFCYFDGSEGASAPYGIHVSNSQYRVFQKLDPVPLFTEGAAKTHFDWHFLTGGNAFDMFAPEEFKEKILEFPFEEAPRMRNDFTRLNFGWWEFSAPGDTVRSSTIYRPSEIGTQADMFEFGTSKAASYDCPATVRCRLKTLESHPRFEDIFETMRRWEDVRQNGFLPDERKEALRDPDAEFTLLINETGEYELVRCTHIKTAAGGNPLLRFFLFERNGELWGSYWHCTGGCSLRLPLHASDLSVMNEIGSEPLPVEEVCGEAVIPADRRRYFRTRLTRKEMIDALENGRLC